MKLNPTLLLSLLSTLILPTLSNPLLVSPRNKPDLPLPVKIIHQFPLGTWLENLAVRKNGKILTTTLTAPELYQVDPDDESDHPPTLVHNFAGQDACTGITELEDDIFYVSAGGLTLSTFTSVVGSWSVYEVDLRNYRADRDGNPPTVTKIAQFPGSILLNGMTVLSSIKKTLLVGDSGAGVVYRLDIRTGAVTKVLDDPLTKGTNPSLSVGVNGLAVRDDTLFFINSNQNILAKIPINEDGTPKGPVSIVSSVEGGDDLALDLAGNAVVAQNLPGRLGVVKGAGYKEVAGGDAAKGSVLVGPTAVRFKRSERSEDDPQHDTRNGCQKVYISTCGGPLQYFTGNITVPGTISSVDLSGYL